MRVWALAMMVMLAVPAWPANLLKNGDFAQPGATATTAAEWSLPEGGAWQRVVGADGKASLVYQAAAGPQGPARGKCDFLTPKTGYTTVVTVESDGTLTPVLRVMDLGANKELARAAGQQKAGLQRWGVTFTPETADVGLELYAEVAHLEGKAAPAGKVRFVQASVESVLAEVVQRPPAVGPNLALKRPYTYEPAPNYSLCSDPDDKIQLTDGVYTEGHFWTRKTTVGWAHKPVLITIDLGTEQPIKGLSFNTAAGVAGVHWPQRILVIVSSDGQQWYEAGNLITLNEVHDNLPAPGQYAVRPIWTDQLNTRGRYVCLYVEPRYGSYVFVDEIEIYGGGAELLAQPYRGESFSSPRERMERSVLAELLRAQFRWGLAAVGEDLAQLPAARQAELARQAAALETEIAAYDPGDPQKLTGILPINELEARVYRLQAAVWRAAQKPLLRVWTKHRWEPLAASEEPVSGAPPAPLEVHLMNNEWRSATFNLTNAGDSPLRVGVRVRGLPGGVNPTYLQVHEVLTVGTRRFVPVSAALPKARRERDGAYGVTVPAGMTRQVWLSFKPLNLPAQTHNAQIELTPATGNRQTLPLKLVVYPLRFPEKTSLFLGGWDYTDSEQMYGITRENKAAVIAHLKENYVNTTWASGGAMPWGRLDEQGKQVLPEDTSRFDNWVKLWPGGQRFMVFLNTPDHFLGAKIGTAEFTERVGAWARFWAQHLRRQGLQPGQLGLLLVDEPHGPPQYDIIIAWAKALKAAAPELIIFEDPQPTDLKDPIEMFKVCDILCPYRNPFLGRAQEYRDLFLDFGKQGKELWFYNADGPARTFDPFSFYLVQHWHAFAIGAVGSHFWAMADSGGVSCWNEYPAKGGGPYCPSYIDATSVTTSKYMEASREGVQDYEYLVMLRERVAALEKKGDRRPAVRAARELLESGPQRVLAGEKGPNYRWDEPKDRTVQDQVRGEVLQALVQLSK